MDSCSAFYLLAFGLLIATVELSRAETTMDLVQTCRGPDTPARLSHLNGLGAHGYLEPLPSSNIEKYTKLLPFAAPARQTPIFLRLSSDPADDMPDGKGFALRFYTTDGLWDMIGTHIPIFPLHQANKYPNFIASVSRDPDTNYRDPIKFWTFFTQNPESLLYILLLFSNKMADIPGGRYPSSLQTIDGAGMHTYRLTNDLGTSFWARFYFISNQNTETHQNVSSSPSLNDAMLDMYAAINDQKFPTWTMNMQIMTQEQVDSENFFNPFDLTRLWPVEKYPHITIGQLVLNRNPDDYSDIDKIAFTPAHVIPGIQLASQNLDTLLGLRVTVYSQVQAQRLGAEYQKLNINNGQKYNPMSGVCGAGQKIKQVKKPSFMTAHPGVNNVNHKSVFVQAQEFYGALSTEDQARLAVNLARRLKILNSPELREKTLSYLENASQQLAKDVQNFISS